MDFTLRQQLFKYLLHWRLRLHTYLLSGQWADPIGRCGFRWRDHGRGWKCWKGWKCGAVTSHRLWQSCWWWNGQTVGSTVVVSKDDRSRHRQSHAAQEPRTVAALRGSTRFS